MNMKRLSILSTVFILMTGGMLSQSYEVVDVIQVPGSDGTYLFHMNSQGHVAGRATFGSGQVQSFIWDGNQFIYFSFPGAIHTSADGVNEKGEATGSYLETDSDVRKGFVRSRAGDFVSISVPGSRHTVVNTITPSGWMVGPFIEADCEPTSECIHSFLWKDSTFFQLDVPGGVATDARDINAKGDIVGTCNLPENQNIQFGFLLSDGYYDLIQYPGATFTNVHGISNCGEIVGYGSNRDEGWREYFIYKFGYFEEIIMPMEMSWAWISDINCKGEISGFYEDLDGKRRGFILRPVHSR